MPGKQSLFHTKYAKDTKFTKENYFWQLFHVKNAKGYKGNKEKIIFGSPVLLCVLCFLGALV